MNKDDMKCPLHVANILTEISEIKVILTELTITQKRNTESLEHHIKRTDLLEKRIEEIDARELVESSKMKTYITFIKGAGWMISIITSIVLILMQFNLVSFHL